MHIASVESPENINAWPRAAAWAVWLLCLVFAVGVFVPNGARAAIGFVQSASQGVDASSISVSFSRNVTANNVIAVYVGWLSTTQTLNNITDTCGSGGGSDAYTIVDNPTTNSTTGRAAMAYAVIGKSGTCTVTASFSGSQHDDIIVHEISGVNTATPLDGHKVNSQDFPGTGTDAITSGNITTTQNRDYIFGASLSSNGTTFTAGTGYTFRNTQLNASFNMASEDEIQMTAGSIAATFTGDQAGDHPLTGIMAFVPASGIQVSSRSDTLSDSRPSATSNHTFTFTVNNSIVGSSASNSSTLTLIFDPAFTLPVGMDCGDIDAATSVQFNFNYPGCKATATAWGFTATGSVIVLTPPSGTGVYVPTSTQITINIGSNATQQQQGSHRITNPSTAGTYTISVGGTFGGSGNMLVSINSAATVQVAVAESLAFTVSSVKAVNCSADDGATVSAVDTSPTSVPLGTLFPANSFFIGCQDLVVSTNAGGGYSVTVQEQTLMKTLGGFTIPQTACDAGDCTGAAATTWATPTHNGFGHTCFNQDGNHDCASTYSNGTKFRPTANVAAGDTAQTIMASSTPASVTGRIKFRISAGVQQPAGTYTTTIVYTITPTY